MTESYQEQQKWLDERFSHVTTILSNIGRNVAELKELHRRCVNRCNSERGQIHNRLRDLEQKQAARNGFEEHRKQKKQSENVAWQMVIALASALSAVAVFIGYFIGRG